MRISGIHPSPLGIAMIVLLLVGSVYYLLRLSSMQVNEPISMKQLLVAGIEIAERGGHEVKQVHEEKQLEEKSKGETLEGANDPLTNGDLRSHKVMMETFHQTFPHVKVISEEKERVEQSSFIQKAPLNNREVDSLVGEDEIMNSRDITVWIDPLDATVEYTDWSWVGHGSNIHEEPRPDDKHIVIVSRSHKGDVTKTAQQAFGEKVQIMAAGGAGYKSLALFNGKASVYVHTTLIKKWDICAGSAILRHAEGKMTTLKGEPIDFSADGSPKNKGGLLASLHGHSEYLEKLGSIL